MFSLASCLREPLFLGSPLETSVIGPGIEAENRTERRHGDIAASKRNRIRASLARLLEMLPLAAKQLALLIAYRRDIRRELSAGRESARHIDQRLLDMTAFEEQSRSRGEI